VLQAVARYRPEPGRLVLPDVCCDVALVGGRLFFTGPLTHARDALHIGEDVLLMRIGVSAARSLLAVPLSELADRIIPLEEINRSLARNLARQLERGSVAAYLERLLQFPADARLVAATRALARGRTVSDTAKAVELGERQLERLLQDRVGVAPKAFTRIVRFRRAVIAARQGMPLADAAFVHGYADQAHFTRDVSALTGRSPRALLARMPDVASVQDAARWRDVGCE
jgi:AraC-like DNA-binding protein